MPETRIRALILCLLEVIKTRELKEEAPELASAAEQIGCSPSDLQAALETARNEGLVSSEGGLLALTGKGEREVTKHREQYIHERHIHRRGFLGHISRRLEGRVENWRGHWRHRHGFNNESLDSLERNIQALPGRIEETVPLANLRQGEKGVVAYVLGGRGVLRRLSDMGLTPGTEVTVVRRAPFTGPVKITVRGVSLVLGRGVASKVFVKTAG